MLKVEACKKDGTFLTWTFTDDADVGFGPDGAVVIRDEANSGDSVSRPFVLVLNLREYAFVETVS